MLDAAHDPFVSREESPLGATRRGLFDLLAQLEKLRPSAPMCVDVLAGDTLCGTVEVTAAGLTLANASTPLTSREELARALHEWVAASPHRLTLAPSTTPPSATKHMRATAAEVFARTGALCELPRSADSASRAFAEHAASGRMSVLLRLRERTELLPYPVAGQALDGVGLRALVKLCHAAACLVRPPGWQSASRPKLTWGVLRIRERAYAVVPGDTHIALLSAAEEELDDLFRRTSDTTPPPGQEDASDAI